MFRISFHKHSLLFDDSVVFSMKDCLSVYTGEMLTLRVCVCETESQYCHHFIIFCLVGTVAVGQSTSVVPSVILLASLEQRNCIFSIDF